MAEETLFSSICNAVYDAFEVSVWSMYTLHQTNMWDPIFEKYQISPRLQDDLILFCAIYGALMLYFLFFAICATLMGWFLLSMQELLMPVATSKILKRRRLCVRVFTKNNDLAHLESLCTEIESHPSMREFVLVIHHDLHLDPEDQAAIDAIGRAIANNPRLENVTIECKFYGPPPFSTSVLGAILQRQAPIQILGFVGWEFSQESCTDLIPVFSASTVEQVDLVDCNFQGEGLQFMFQGLRCAPSLSGLYLSFNTELNIENAVAMYSLVSTKKLKMFYYRNLWSISQGLEECGTFAWLLLVRKCITVKNFKAELNLWTATTKEHAAATRDDPAIPLESLDLSQSSVSFRCLREILNALMKASALRELKLGNLKLHSAGLESLKPKQAFTTVRLLLDLVIHCESLIDLEMPSCLSVRELRSSATSTNQRACADAIENRQAIDAFLDFNRVVRPAICAAKTKCDIVEQLVFHRNCLGVLHEVIDLCDITVLLEDVVSIQKLECNDDGDAVD